MAAAESWPLVGSWQCSLSVTKVRGGTTEEGLYAVSFGLRSKAPNRDKESPFYFNNIQQYLQEC